MRQRHRRGLVALLTTVLAVTGVGLAATSSANAGPKAADIVDQLKAIPGMAVVSEGQPPVPGYRFFFLTYDQPVDHRKPNAGTFKQRFQLLHKSTDRPMVLHTTGYNMPEYAFRSEPTKIIDGNQISTEQRFFEPSRPEPADWSKLDIWQGATDHHRLVAALKPIYSAKWVSTGASKGGMTSVYHRRFYPSDVDGVVAYVAPNDTINPEDRRYNRFFETVGTDPGCRAKLDEVQRQALLRREEMLGKLRAQATAEGWTFDQVLGTADRAFEMAVLDTVWAFWQYTVQDACVTVPAANASTDELYKFIDEIVSFGFYADQGILPYTPYYYQAATQMGWADLKFRHLKGLLRYPGLYQANSSLPPDLRSRHEAWPMIDVDIWVRTRSSQMLFVYGGNDPWGAEAFEPSRQDSFSFTAAGANHGANIAALAQADKDAATSALLRWAGVSTQATARTQTFLPELDLRDPRDQRRPL
ncbi:PS-10 peptidase S37 [Herbihabitans rhizosphaerae]|uniref:PS-10 peptidase S37 n=1 Tax=Herbihabitans rhizosphaerae TaxID=1872711 RepID=A0A4V2EU91_9PSEU|nr:S28 family serine protease [Herbihabitans rhizosphaerae]RZS43753.1 PS-10 peptidase S37 [Herbihabitans rhizosphaerae]